MTTKETLKVLSDSYQLFLVEIEAENKKRSRVLEDDLEPTFANYMKWLEFQLNYKDIV